MSTPASYRDRSARTPSRGAPLALIGTPEPDLEHMTLPTGGTDLVAEIPRSQRHVPEVARRPDTADDRKPAAKWKLDRHVIDRRARLHRRPAQAAQRVHAHGLGCEQPPQTGRTGRTQPGSTCRSVAAPANPSDP